MKKLFFVFNPHSGKAMIKNKLLEIVDIFTKAGYEVTIYPTQRSLDGFDRVCEADGKYDMIVCSGGDGTLNEVISAVMYHTSPAPVIGYIPAGSTNDFANTLGIPSNMVKAARNIVEGKVIKCDIGVMNGKYFNYIAAFGLFTEVSYMTPQNVKNVLGHQAYVLESIKRITNIKAYNLTVTCNDMVLKGRYIYGMVTNSLSVGGIKGLTGDGVELNDGLFEVVLVKEPNNAIELQQIVSAFFSKKYDSPMIESFKTSSIVFESDESFSWTLDGENGEMHQRVEISIIHGGVKIVTSIK